MHPHSCFCIVLQPIMQGAFLSVCKTIYIYKKTAHLHRQAAMIKFLLKAAAFAIIPSLTDVFDSCSAKVNIVFDLAKSMHSISEKGEYCS